MFDNLEKSCTHSVAVGDKNVSPQSVRGSQQPPCSQILRICMGINIYRH